MKNELLAPNGKPSNLSPIQYELVRTPAFKKWFGDWENNPANASKVVDENGEPLVVYHGSEEDFNTFKYGEFGFHFGTKEQSENILIDKIKSNSKYLKSFFLNIKTPLESQDFPKWESYVMAKKYHSLGILDKKEEHEIVYDRSGDKDVLFKKVLESKGYDGIFYDNEFEGDGRSYITWNPTKIKIADGTNTTFDSKNPDVRFEKGGITESYVPDYLRMFLGK